MSLAAADDSTGAARARLVDYYIWAATRGHRMLHAYDVRPLADIPDRPATPAPSLESPDEMLAWLDTERENLIAAVEADIAPSQVIDLANALDRHLNRGAHYTENLAVMDAALAAARKINNRAAEATALTSLGRVYGQTSRQAAAIETLTKACVVATEVGDDASLRSATNSLGCVYYDRGDYGQAIELFERVMSPSEGNSSWLEATALGRADLRVSR
jgi:tetratricopeptide (TPR) repeat protein